MYERADHLGLSRGSTNSNLKRPTSTPTQRSARCVQPAAVHPRRHARENTRGQGSGSLPDRGSVITRSAIWRGGTYLFGAPRNEHVSPPTYLSEGLTSAPPIPARNDLRNDKNLDGDRRPARSFVIKSKKLSLRVERTTAASPRPTCGGRPREQSVDEPGKCRGPTP